MGLFGFGRRGDSSGRSEDTAHRLQSLAASLNAATEQKEIISVTLGQVMEMMAIKRACILLVSTLQDTSGTRKIQLEPHSAGDDPMPQASKGMIAENGPFYQRLFHERRALFASEPESNRAFDSAISTEKLFFHQLGMAVYLPVVAHGEVLAVLGVGNKPKKAPYTDADLGLLSTVSSQVGVTLRNVRLVNDLRRREKEASEAKNALQKAKEQLEQLDAVKTDFITIASHELRTPLAQVRGYTDIIEALNEQGILDPEQLSNMTNNLRKATDRMEELIRNMLDVSQLDVDAMDLRFAAVTIDNVVRMAIEPLTESIRNRKQTVSARGLRNLPSIEGDMKRLVQALQNVILNAVKFTPDAGRIDVHGFVQKNPTTGDDEVMVTISDTGIGIDQKNAEIIFEKFVRTQDPSLHSTGKTKFMGAGPGLGLTIARGVIDGHGGRIWAESPGYDPEKFPGSTFYILLPLKPPATAPKTLDFGMSTIQRNASLRNELLEALEQRK